MRFLTKKFSRFAIVQVVALLSMTGAALGAVSLAYTTASTSTLAVAGPPVQYAPGADATATDYVPAFSLSANRTSFSVTLRGIPEATVTLADLMRLTNADGRERTVTLAAAQVTNPFVTTYRFEVLDATGASLGNLDLKEAAPRLVLPAMPPGASYTIKSTVTLASGAGAHNVQETSSVTLDVSA